jgi:hypothetical protein
MLISLFFWGAFCAFLRLFPSYLSAVRMHAYAKLAGAFMFASWSRITNATLGAPRWLHMAVRDAQITQISFSREIEFPTTKSAKSELSADLYSG